MSLISDALKAAQREKKAQSDDDASDRARRFLSRPAGGEDARGVPLGKGRSPLPRSVQVAALVLVLAVAGAAVIAYLAPGPGDVRVAGNRVEEVEPPLFADAEPATTEAASVVEPALEPGTELPTELPTSLDADPDMESAVTVEGDAPAPERQPTVARSEPQARPSTVPARQPDPRPTRAAATAPLQAEGAMAGGAPPAAERVAQPSPSAPAGGAAGAASEPRQQQPQRLQVAVQSQAGVAQLFADAIAAHRRRDYQEAVELYRRALAVDSNNPELYNNLGTTYQALGELARARESFQRALAINARYAAAWSNLGIVLTSLGEDTAAQAALAEAVRLEPTNVAARVNLANLHQTNGRLLQARVLLEEVVRAEPSRAEAQYSLARLLEETGDRSGAARHYRLFLSHAGGRFPELEPRVRHHLSQLEGSDAR